jgi:hypothetical protein
MKEKRKGLLEEAIAFHCSSPGHCGYALRANPAIFFRGSRCRRALLGNLFIVERKV